MTEPYFKVAQWVLPPKYLRNDTYLSKYTVSCLTNRRLPLQAVSKPNGGVDGSQKFPAMFCDDGDWCGLVVHSHDPSARRSKLIYGALVSWEAE